MFFTVATFWDFYFFYFVFLQGVLLSLTSNRQQETVQLSLATPTTMEYPRDTNMIILGQKRVVGFRMLTYVKYMNVFKLQNYDKLYKIIRRMEKVTRVVRRLDMLDTFKNILSTAHTFEEHELNCNYIHVILKNTASYLKGSVLHVKVENKLI